jgi:serine beta-lactamase-like protein LACTB
MDDHRVGRAKVPAKSVTSKPDESPIKGDYSVIRDMPYIRIVPNGDRYWRLPLIGGTVSIEPNSKLPAELSRMSETKPINAPNHWLGLIGEYGPESDPAYVFEDRGQLCLLVGRRTYLPLRELGLDSYWSDSRLNWDGTPVKFTRDESNRALAFTLAGIRFDRRNLPGEGAPVFKIQPERPVEQLLAESRKATPPPMRGEFAKPDLVDLSTLDPTLKFDIRYATADNFLGTPVYPVARALLQRPAADALVRVHKGLERDGYGLIIHDAYRPWHITKVFWDATPKVHHGFVADPLTGSRHNRGCAVDLSLYDRATGRTVEMTSGYDEFSDRAYPNYPGGTSLARWQRDKLRSAMEAEGFTVFSAEWWHFDYRDWKKYPVQNEPLEKPLR